MNLNTAIQSSLKKVTAEFTRAKMQAYRQREDRVSQWQIDRWEKQDEETTAQSGRLQSYSTSIHGRFG